MPNPSELERVFAADGTNLERCRVDPPGCIRHIQMPVMKPVSPPERIGPGPVCPHCGGDYGFHADTCPVRQPVQLSVVPPTYVDRRTGLPAEHPAERAAREYHQQATFSWPEVAELRQRVAELELLVAAQRQALTVKDQLISAQAERISAQAELLSRAAGKS